MNTTVSKSFGLALLLAVGIIAVMVAMGTFSAQKAGAQDTTDVLEGSIEIDSETPSAGAAVQIKVRAEFTDPVEDFGEFIIELEGYGLPDSIDVKDVLVRVGTGADSLTLSGNPSNVDVSGNSITIELDGGTTDDPGIEITSTNDYAEITIRKRAGVTAPALAGKYDVSVGDETAEELVTVSPALKLDPKKGGSATEITVSGKAFANGTGSLYTETLTNPDQNNDGIIDTLISGDNIPGETDNGGWGLNVDADDDVAEYDLLLVPAVAAIPTADPPVVAEAAYYAAVPTDATSAITQIERKTGTVNVVALGYRITLAPAPTDDRHHPGGEHSDDAQRHLHWRGVR